MKTITKKMTSALLLMLLLNNVWATGNKEKGTEKENEKRKKCLLLEGMIEKGPFHKKKEYLVRLYSNGEVIDSVTLCCHKSFQFTLLKNKHYGLRIDSEGCVPKIVSINTTAPDDLNEMVCFSFKTGMINYEESKVLDRDYLDYPVAMVCYNKTKKCFTLCPKYEAFIKRSVKLEAAEK